MSDQKLYALYDRTIEMLKSTDQPIERIASGSGVGKWWLYRLKRGEFDDPGVKRIQSLHDYLSSEGSKPC